MTQAAVHPAPEAVVSAEAVRCWLSQGEALLIDVREPEEIADEAIPGAIALPLSSFDPSAIPASDGRRRILFCLSGKRSAAALQRLNQAGVTGLLHLDGGLLGFKKAGGRTIESDAA